MEDILNIQLQKLIDKTKQKKISWKSFAPNNLRWVKQEGNRLFTVVLQKRPLPPIPTIQNLTRKEDIILTMQATNPNEILFNISTLANSETQHMLDTLYTEAWNSSTEGLNDIIDQLLNDI